MLVTKEHGWIVSSYVISTIRLATYKTITTNKTMGSKLYTKTQPSNIQSYIEMN